MSFTALVSDSTAGLSEAFVKKHNIRIVPLYLKIGEETLLDGIDISADQFYERLPLCEVLPTTSQPSVGDFSKVYHELAKQGATGIISVHLSSEISGTVSSARLAAKEMSGVRIEVVDTRSAAAAQMLAVEAGAKALESGATFDGALAAIQQVLDRQRTLFTLDTLEYLYKGGRIGGAAALLGSLLQFKPLLYFKEGRIDALERVRTSRRAPRRMIELMVDWLGKDDPLEAVVLHAACPERAQKLADLLPGHLNIAHLRIAAVPPVLGAHVGNGTMALCCCPTRVCGHSSEASAS